MSHIPKSTPEAFLCETAKKLALDPVHTVSDTTWFSEIIIMNRTKACKKAFLIDLASPRATVTSLMKACVNVAEPKRATTVRTFLTISIVVVLRLGSCEDDIVREVERRQASNRTLHFGSYALLTSDCAGTATNCKKALYHCK